MPRDPRKQNLHSDPEEYLRRFPELKLELKSLFNRIDRRENEFRILGDFKIIREVGSGGIGIVYEAEQISLDRKVALKVLNTHLQQSDRAVLKFYREALASGRLQHPGIVTIYVVGEHDGVSFIAEEFVNGGRSLKDRIDEARNEKEPSKEYFREIAELIAEAANALVHVHASGVIHRDIKPSNILLTREGKAKLIDFGLAHVEGAFSLSRTADFSGTPSYMSFEQSRGRRDLIDHRTDTYSLGATLYECLTRERPHQGSSSHEVLHKIQMHDPVDPRRKAPNVPIDLSVICLKAMEKEPRHRYADMAAFEADLRCFLRGEEISARPVNGVVKAWKRIRRNPSFFAAGFMAVLALCALVLLYPQLLKEKISAVEAQQEATDRVEEISALNAFINNVLIDPPSGEAKVASERLAESMSDAVKWVEREYPEKSRISVSVRNTWAMSLCRLGMPKKAEPIFREVLEFRKEALGDDNLFTNVSRNNLAVALHDLGKLEEAASLYEKVIDNHRRILGDDHLNTCTVMNNYARLLDELGRYAEGEALLRRLLDINRRNVDEEHQETLRVRTNLALNLLLQGKPREAEPHITETWTIKKRVLGESHRETLRCPIQKGMMLLLDNRLGRAEKTLRDAVEHCSEALGEDHPYTLAALHHLAAALYEKGEFREAEAFCLRAVEGRKRKLGPEAPPALRSMGLLAEILLEQGRRGEAEKQMRLALETQQRILGAGHPDTISTRDRLAGLFADQ